MTRHRGQTSWHNTRAQSVFNLSIPGVDSEHLQKRKVEDQKTSPLPKQKKAPHLFFKVNEGTRKQVKKPKEL